MWMVWAKDLLPASWCGAEVLRDIVDGVPVSVAVVLGPVCVEVDGLHGPHEGVPHPHPVLHHHVDILRAHNPVPEYSRCLASAERGSATLHLMSLQHSLRRAYCILLRTKPGSSRDKETGPWPTSCMRARVSACTCWLVQGAGTSSTMGVW